MKDIEGCRKGGHSHRNRNDGGFEWVEKLVVNLTGKGTMEGFEGCRSSRGQSHKEKLRK
jgi:hypothetical protein